MTAILEPYVNALAHLITYLGVVGVLVFAAAFCWAAVAGSARKQRRRLERFQRERKGGSGWSI